jgi:ribosome-associated protein
LLERGLPAIEDVIARWPQADRQHLRQLLLQIQREQQREQPPATRRKLFRYLRELDDAASASPAGGMSDAGDRGNSGG